MFSLSIRLGWGIELTSVPANTFGLEVDNSQVQITQICNIDNYQKNQILWAAIWLNTSIA